MMAIKYPVTIRQAQKMLRRLNMCQVGDRKFLRSLDEAMGYIASYDRACTARWLAQEAARKGPSHIILASPESLSQERSDSGNAESRPKGTNEVRPQSDNPSEDSPFHGGDGASGEVEDGQSQGRQKNGGANNMDNPGSDSTPAAGESRKSRMMEDAPSSSAEMVDDAGQKPDQPASETGEATSEEVDTNQLSKEAKALRDDGTPDTESQPGKSALPGSSVEDAKEGDSQGNTVTKEASTGSDTPIDALTSRANQMSHFKTDSWEEGDMIPKEAGDDAEESSEKGQYKYRKGGNGQSSKRSKHSHGGVTASMRRVGITSSLIKRARKAMARLIEGGETETGPRYNWKDFSKRLKTYRSLAPARKEEEGRPAILILADVSGSCAGFSDKSLMVAKAVAQLGVNGADVIIVAHSNGNPVEWSINGKPSQKFFVGWDESEQWYEDTLRRFNLRVVIALGDWDAEWLYHILAEKSAVQRFIWLDNWSCSILPVTVRHDLFKSAARERDYVDWSTPWQFETPWSRRAKAKSIYVVGCAEAEDFLTGIELGIRRK